MKIKRLNIIAVLFSLILCAILNFNIEEIYAETVTSITLTHKHTDETGACYAPVYHTHTGSSSARGGCYADPIYHVHEGSTTYGGSCYSNLKSCGGNVERYKTSSSCYNGGGAWGTCSNWSVVGGSVCGTHGCFINNGSVSCYCPAVYKCQSCGRNYGSSPPSRYKCTNVTGYALSCNKSSSTIDSYQLSCGKTTSTIDSYSQVCVLEEVATIATINIEKEITDISYLLKPVAKDVDTTCTIISYTWDNGDIGNCIVTSNGTYTCTISYTDSGVEKTATISYVVEDYLTEIEGTIYWNDKSNQYGSRPDSIKVILYRNNIKIDEMDVSTSTDNENTYIFKDLYILDSSTGEKYIYTVSQETAVSKNTDDKYITSQSEYNFTNTLGNNNNESEDVLGVNPDISEIGHSVKGNIIWEDNNDAFGYRPQYITLTLYKNGEKVISGELDVKMYNNYQFTNLPKYDENMELFIYTVEEKINSQYLILENGKYIPEDAYSISSDSYNFINTFNSQTVPIISVKPEHRNEITISAPENTYITLTQMETILNEDGTTSYTNNYSGIIYNIYITNEKVSLENISSGKYEIEISNSKYIIEDIVLSNGNGNISIIKENDKSYLIIEENSEDNNATLEIIVKDKNPEIKTKENHIGYISNDNKNNFWKINSFD